MFEPDWGYRKQRKESRGDGRGERGRQCKPNIHFDKSDISETQQERFLSMTDQFSDIFAIDLGKTSLSEHTIDTGTSQPIKNLPGVHHPIRGKLLTDS